MYPVEYIPQLTSKTISGVVNIYIKIINDYIFPTKLYGWALAITTQFRDGPWPDPTQAYFWPAVNKRPTRLWLGYFSTQPKEIFFDPKGEKLKNLMLLGEIFQSQTQTINGWPDPGQKILTRTHHYYSCWSPLFESLQITITLIGEHPVSFLISEVKRCYDGCRLNPSPLILVPIQVPLTTLPHYPLQL